MRSTLLFLIYDFGGIMDKYKKKKDSYNLVFAIIWGLLFVYWFTTAIYNESMKSYITTLNKAIEYTDMIKPKELEFKKINQTIMIETKHFPPFPALPFHTPFP